MYREAFKEFLPRNPRHWIGVALSLAIAGVVVGTVVLVSGVANLRASDPHPAGWARLLHYAFGRSVAFHADDAPPPPADLNDAALVMRGAGHYANVCANCHGAPGLGQNPIALSMRPEPPRIDEVASRYSDKELYYILENGVAYSSMPAWPVEDRPDEVWSMVAFLKKLPGMSLDTYRDLALNAKSVTGAESRMVDAKMPFGDTEAEIRVDPAVTTPSGKPTDKVSPDGVARKPSYAPGDPQALAASATVDHPSIGFVPDALGGQPLQICARCHGVDGNGRSGGAYPNLTLQGETYLENTLTAYSTRTRDSGIMWPVAAQLSKGQIHAIAEYFGKMQPKPSEQDAPDPALVARGETIAKNGVTYDEAGPDHAAGKVAACDSCHGLPTAEGNVFPHLAGQYATYLETQMHVFRSGGRGQATSYNPMSAVSHDLADADIEALAAYYAALPPERKDAGDTNGNSAAGAGMNSVPADQPATQGARQPG